MASRRMKKAAIVFGIGLALVLAVELIARIAGPPCLPQDSRFVDAPEWSYPGQIAKDTELFWRYRPNQTIVQDFFAPGEYTINAHGFRGPDFPVEKPSGVLRVVCLGGSTTFGWGVPDGAEYPRQLETRLNALDPEHRRWQVINAGVTNYSTHQGLGLARRVLGHWQPDIVLFNFSWGDHQPAANGVPDRNIRMPSGWRLGLENALMQSVAVQYVCGFLMSHGTSSADTAPIAHTTWRADLTTYVANEEKLIRVAADVGARPIWVTSPIAWPPPGQSDSSGIFHYHHRYHRAALYGAVLGGGEIAELANSFNFYRAFFDNPSVDFEHFNATGHNFAGDHLARSILGLPLDRDAPTRLDPDASSDQ